MLMPKKEMSPTEQSRWEDALSDRAFGDRVARFNKSQARKLEGTFTSKAKKWRDYYSHDSGKARFIIYQPSSTERSRRNKYSPADVFVRLQQEPVSELISQESCSHPAFSEEVFSRKVRVEDALQRWGYRREDHEHKRETCSRCKWERVTDMVTGEVSE